MFEALGIKATTSAGKAASLGTKELKGGCAEMSCKPPRPAGPQGELAVDDAAPSTSEYRRRASITDQTSS